MLWLLVIAAYLGMAAAIMIGHTTSNVGVDPRAVAKAAILRASGIISLAAMACALWLLARRSASPALLIAFFLAIAATFLLLPFVV